MNFKDALNRLELSLNLKSNTVKDKEKIRKNIELITSNPQYQEMVLLSEIDTFIKQREFQAALNKCDSLLIINPLSKSAHHRKGIIYGRGNLNLPNKSIQEFEEAK